MLNLKQLTEKGCFILVIFVKIRRTKVQSMSYSQALTEGIVISRLTKFRP